MSETQKVIESHFLNLFSIALSDTQIDAVELAQLYEFGEKRNVNKESIDALLLNPDKVKFTIPEDLVKKIEYLYEFAVMIWADGRVDDFERDALEKFCFKFGFQKENIKDIVTFLLEEAKNETPFEEIKNQVISLGEQ